MKMKPPIIDPIIKYPNGLLRQQCAEVTSITPEVKNFAQQLLIICRLYEGQGLSAPQVGKSIRIIVVDNKLCPLVKDFGYQPGDCSPTPVEKEYMRERHPYLINPVISNIGEAKFKYKEGCLSLPGVNGWVTRPSSFDVTFMALDGKTYTEHITDTSKDKYGIIVQHEIDHLDGKLFTDKMSGYDLLNLTNKMNKLRRK